MKLTKLILPILILMIAVCHSSYGQDFRGETLSITSTDDIELKAEFYNSDCDEKPLILLFHQAGYSRGEYREIGPKLNELGFCALAIDQRSGSKVNGIKNDAVEQAKKKGLKTDYVSAFADLEATLDYVLEKQLAPNGVILLGSSYSSSLIFVLASEHPEHVKGLAAFSPGEYFKYDGRQISDFAKKVKCPVFITSAGNEKKNWEDIYDNVNSKKQFYLPETKGYHGAKALWSTNEGNEKYWEALKVFLSQY